MRASLCGLCAVLLCAGTLCAQVESDVDRAVCDGDKDINGSSTTTWDMPLHSAARTARLSSIYLATEFGCDGGTIDGLRYYIQTKPSQILNAFTIRMRQTTSSAYSVTTFDNTGWTTVYQAPFDPNSAYDPNSPWTEFQFSTPFVFSAASNLEVDVTFNNPTATSSGLVYYYNGTGNRSLFKYCAACDCGGSTNPLLWTTCAGVTPSPRVPRVQFVFAPVPGACCHDLICTENVYQAACQSDGGMFMGPGSTCTQGTCSGACCYKYPDVECLTVSAAQCTALSGIWHQGQDCATYFCPPWNDDCTAVTPVPLEPNVPHQFTGDNRGATNDCASFPGGQVWHAFTLPGTAGQYWDVTLDYCGTSPAFGNYWLQCATGCPCAGTTPTGTLATCPEPLGNASISWKSLPTGTNYFYPVLLDPNTAAGPYTLHVVAQPGYCPGNASTCDEYIQRVQVAAINNASACTTGGYGDYTSTSTTMPLGSTYPIAVTIGNYFASDKAYVWVDWNHDSTLNNTLGDGERFDLAGTGATRTGNIVVPLDAALGSTRMRVRVESDGFGPVRAPCGTSAYGEVEDYTVNVGVLSGACCYANYTCEVTTQAACTGTWLGADVPCDQCPPAPTGACCYANYTCEVTTQAACAGTWLGANVPCDQCPPAPTGACCQGPSCALKTRAECTALGGIYQADGQLCEPNPCAPSGVCVGDMNCDNQVDFSDINPFVLYLSNFSAWQSTYNGCDARNGDINTDGTYGQASFGDINPFVALLSSAPLPIPCTSQPSTGACCTAGSICQILSEPDCQNASGTYKGAGSSCDQHPCVCVGDMNCDGQVDFGDINPFVLYLSSTSAWQATYVGCPMLNGDINADETYGQSSFGDINPFVILLSTPPFPHVCTY